MRTRTRSPLRTWAALALLGLRLVPVLVLILGTTALAGGDTTTPQPSQSVPSTLETGTSPGFLSLEAGADVSSGAEASPQTKRTPAERVTDAIENLGVWGPVAYVALFVTLCVFCIPSVFLTIAGGALFGLGWGFLYAWLGAQLGASIAFFISRRVAHDWVARRLHRLPLLSAVEEAVSTEGWKIVGLLRLAPGAPYFLLNYLFGLTRVRYKGYVLATMVSSVPGILTFVYLGSLGHMAASGRIRTWWDWVLYGVGLAAIALASYLVARRAKVVLDRRLRSDPATLNRGEASIDPRP